MYLGAAEVSKDQAFGSMCKELSVVEPWGLMEYEPSKVPVCWSDWLCGDIQPEVGQSL